MKELKQVDSGSGVVICEPVYKGPAPSTLAFADGSVRWLQYVIGGHPELGKTPTWETIAGSVDLLKRKDLRLTSVDAALLAKRLALTHVVVSEVSGAPGACRLVLRLLQMPGAKSVGAGVVLEGTPEKVATLLPSAARTLAGRMGVVTPRVPEVISERVDDFELFGRTGWLAPSTPNHAREKALEKTARRSELGMLLYLSTTQTLEPRVAARIIYPAMVDFTQRAGDNALAYAEVARIHETVRLRRQFNPFAEALDARAAKYPNCYGFQTALSWLESADGRHEPATRAAEQAVRCATRSPEAWRKLARSLSNLAGEVRINRTIGRMNSAELATVQKIYPRVLSLYRHAVTLDPEWGEGWQYVASTAAFAGDGQASEAALWKALQLHPGLPNTYWWGLQYFQPKWYGDEKKRERVAKLAAAAEFRTPEYRRFVAQTLYHNGYPALAARVPRTAAERAELTRWIAENFKAPAKPGAKPEPEPPFRMVLCHNAPVAAAAWSPDGKMLASVGWDRIVRLWESIPGKEHLLHGHADAGTSLGWSPDGKRLATGGMDGSVRIWDVVRRTELLAFTAHSQRVRSVAWRPGGELLATTSDDGTSYLWDPADGKRRRQLDRDATLVKQASFSPDGKRLATCVWDPTEQAVLRIWDVESGVLSKTLKGPASTLMGAEWSPDGRWIAAVATDNTLRIWNGETGEEKTLIRDIEDTPFCVSWSPDGSRIASIGNGGVARVWDALAGKLLVSVQGHAGSAATVDWSPDGTRLASAGIDRKVLEWTLSRILDPAVLGKPAPPRPEGPVGPPVLSIRPARMFPVQGVLPPALAFSSDSALLAVGGQEKIHFYDSKSGMVARTLPGPRFGPLSLALSPDNGLLALGQTDGLVVLDAVTGQQRWGWKQTPRPGINNRIPWVGFSTDGSRIAAIHSYDNLKWWDVSDGRLFRNLQDDGQLLDAAFAGHGKLLASAVCSPNRWGDVNLWNTQTGAREACLEGHADSITALAFSHDSSRLATASIDRSVRVWDVNTRKTLFELKGHSAPVGQVTFLAGNRWVVSTDGNGTLIVWDAQTGAQHQTIRDLGRGLTSLTASPDGKMLALCVRPPANQLQVWLWEVSP